MDIQTPEWVKHAIFYQIYPDRFARSPRTRHSPGLSFKPWGTSPQEQGYQGGDLRGITDRLDYLQKLGITALYLNPIFASASNHRYHTFDYFQVDPLLGGNDALRDLLDAAHARKMRVVLDGVFNHASRGFWQFHHILENGDTSPYLDWFTVKGYPLRPYNSDPDNPPNYDCWWNLPALPKFNTNNPGVRDYIFSVARYWIEFGIDGWRLDVPAEIDDDLFWQEFRRVVKDANPEAYIVGEIWEPAQRWLQGDQFDAVMNYVFSRAAMGYFGRKTLNTRERPGGYPWTLHSTRTFAAEIEAMHALYDWQVTQVQLNLLDSHDTPRALWQLNDDETALRMSVLLKMTLPGAPCIYYGDEVGMTGGPDPMCRAAFPWDNEAAWNTDLLEFYRRATAMRHQHPSLRTGSFHTLYANKGVYVFARQQDDQTVVVLFNNKKKPFTLDIPVAEIAPDEQVFTAVWNEGTYTVTDGKLANVTLPARDAVVLIAQQS